MTRLHPSGLGTILGVWAHPDDEAYLSAGVMALARAAGQRVVVVTATRGERGTPDPASWSPQRLGRLREAEVAASLAALGVAEHHFLDYGDGTLPAHDSNEGIRRIADIMRDVRPHTVLTFGPDGITGHGDHRVISAWTTTARDQAAPRARLLYATTTAAFVDRWRHIGERYDIYLDRGLPLRTPLAQVALDVVFDADLADRKQAALRAQASQTAGLIAAMGERQYRAWTSTETFTLARHAAPTAASRTRQRPVGVDKALARVERDGQTPIPSVGASAAASRRVRTRSFSRIAET